MDSGVGECPQTGPISERIVVWAKSTAAYGSNTITRQLAVRLLGSSRPLPVECYL